ncbi:MAG: type IV secretion system DNA-binding domain-containing protein [Gammaproteobacteria bacterium]|nr:type IV secretion system DNA-binding domain-containing protein [Gammaproteobacteria bacterium]
MATDDYKAYRRFAHKLNLNTKALATRFKVFAIIMVLITGSTLALFANRAHLQNTVSYGVAKVMIMLDRGDSHIMFTNPANRHINIVSREAVINPHILESRRHTLWYLFGSLVIGSVIAALVTLLFTRIFKVIYKEQKTKQLRLRGAEKIDAAELADAIQSDGLGSPFMLGNVPWVEDKIRRHLYLSGDTGVGKSQTLMQIMQEVRNLGQKALVVDKSGELFNHFYNPDTDVLLSPFDERSAYWTPFSEGTTELALERISRSFIPTLEQSGRDDHWPEAAVTVFSALLYQVSHHSDFDGSIDIIFEKILESTRCVEADLLGNEREVVKRGILELLSGTFASLLIDPDSPEHASSVLASIAPKVRSMRFLRGLENRPLFSIRNWISDDTQTGWLFIRVSEEQMDAVGPLITAWIDTAIKAVLSLPKCDDRVVWNFIDELQSFGKINSLKKSLYEGRKHGLRNVLGFTSVNELFSIYGRDSATAMLAGCNTKLVFQTDEPTAAKWNADLLGMEEVIYENENAHYGGHQDSMGASDQRQDKYIVMPSEIQRLPNLTAYLKFSGDWPVTKIKTEYQRRAIVAETFIERHIPPPQVVNQVVIEKSSDETGKAKDWSSEVLNEPLL